MEDSSHTVHRETDQARAGSTPNVVRWVLGIGLFAAIALLSAIWIFSAATTNDDVKGPVSEVETSGGGMMADPTTSAPEPVTDEAAGTPPRVNNTGN
ncbi:hypothetical protein GRI97_16195 [Altererythrobacter xixiisoli]|uniref:Uncharacterized protein n=1 Tax=Croceibacterium xixiisoli TaxID=1476466 RepID=A0A6I4TZM9_9SPHN|nr:hypothetical protein [Croceibacterium xixiisoli]MXP00532.1 hypothetical protein [Croceibacterium xixiisoli]